MHGVAAAASETISAFSQVNAPVITTQVPGYCTLSCASLSQTVKILNMPALQDCR
jgi:hypothetical protein